MATNDKDSVGLISQLKGAIRSSLPPGMLADLRTVRHSVSQLTQGVRSRLSTAPTLRRVEGTGIKLNLGCGSLTRAGWINVDLAGADYIADLRDGLKLRAGCARHIHCEHFLEHLEIDDAIQLIRDAFTALENGGTLRIVVPDAERYFSAYCRNDREFFESLAHLGGAVRPLRTRAEVINHMFRMGGAHKFAWDFETLSQALVEAGFSNVERSSCGALPPDLDIDGRDEWRILESLYVNAVKQS